MDERKDSAIQFRLSRDLHNRFILICSKKNVIPAEWLRKQIEELVKEEKK